MSPSRPAGVERPARFTTSLAELVANILRQRIIGAELADGEFLPRQEALMEEFHVSRSSIREALRILETEGLVTVKRGKFGGAVVHAPNTHNAAHPLGVILQSLGTDVRQTLCAASRPHDDGCPQTERNFSGDISQPR